MDNQIALSNQPQVSELVHQLSAYIVYKKQDLAKLLDNSYSRKPQFSFSYKEETKKVGSSTQLRKLINSIKQEGDFDIANALHNSLDSDSSSINYKALSSLGLRVGMQWPKSVLLEIETRKKENDKVIKSSVIGKKESAAKRRERYVPEEHHFERLDDSLYKLIESIAKNSSLSKEQNKFIQSNLTYRVWGQTDGQAGLTKTIHSSPSSYHQRLNELRRNRTMRVAKKSERLLTQKSMRKTILKHEYDFPYALLLGNTLANKIQKHK